MLRCRWFWGTFCGFVKVRFTKLEAVLASVILVAGALAFNDILYKF